MPAVTDDPWDDAPKDEPIALTELPDVPEEAEREVDSYLQIATPSNLVTDAIPDAPDADHHLVPIGYSLQDEAGAQQCLFKTHEHGRRPLADNPVIITAWVSNRTTGDKALELAWKAQGTWRRAVRDRSVLLDKGKIIAAVANTGFPVNDTNKRQMVQYLVAYQQQNIAHIKTKHISEQMGWQKDGTFLVGPNAIGGDVEFHSPDAGEMQLVDAVRSRGELEEWKQAVSVIAAYPSVELALYASLVPPLLGILEAPSFGIDWSYQTSSGKTTALRIAASVWGSPDERSGQSYIRSWGGTEFGIERLASVYNGLPLLLDDSKRARKRAGQSVIADVLYTVVNGIADVRATRYGLRHTRYWRTVLLSTGEARIIDATKDGGTAARALCLWGPPFGPTSQATGSLIRDLDRRLKRNYGHAGPLFVEWLQAHQDEWPRWSEQLLDLAAELEGTCVRLTDAGVASRVTDYLAILELAARLAHRALDLPWQLVSPIKKLAPQLAQGASATDRAAEALAHAYEWAMGNKQRFWSKNDQDKRDSPYGGWLGRWDRDTDDRDLVPERWGWIGFLRGPLVDELERNGFEPEACVRLWADRGKLKQVKDRKSSIVARVWGGEHVRLICLLRDAVDPESPKNKSDGDTAL